MLFGCARYKLLDLCKQTPIAAKLFYYGVEFRHFGPIVLTGVVIRCAHNATDGDVCFDISVGSDQESPGHWHCELTPCQPDTLRQRARSLKEGDRVIVSGTKTIDGRHHIGSIQFVGGGNEVHPVTDIKIL